MCRFRRPCCLRLIAAYVQLLGKRVRNPLRAQTFVCCVRCIDSGLWDELITRLGKSYPVCVCARVRARVCIIVCDLKTSTMRWLCPHLGCYATEKEIIICSNYSPILFRFTNKWVKFSLLCMAFRVVSCRIWTSRHGVTRRATRVEFVVENDTITGFCPRTKVFPSQYNSIFIYILSGGRTVDPWYDALPPRISSHRKNIQRGMAGVHSYLFGYKTLDKMLRITLFILFSSFRRVSIVICSFLGNSSASEF